MTFEKTYEIKGHDRLIIHLPERFKSKDKVKVRIEAIEDDREEKISKLKKAAKDSLFLADISEITIDFKDSDEEQS
ncbi:MAG: hypothetical protein K9I94_10410 [Bacteroidales bacterium]|nr:hypothetical protein [Bacteroidales bacterium]